MAMSVLQPEIAARARHLRITPRLAAACAVGMISSASAALAAPPVEDVLVVEPNALIAASVNGMNVMLAMEPDGLSIPALDPALAKRLALSGGISGAQARVGPVKIAGRSGTVQLQVGRAVRKQKAVWFDKPMVAGADGALEPDAAPHPSVMFRLSDPTAPGVTSRLPLVRKNNRDGTEIEIAGAKIFVQWTFARAGTLATAAAASSIALANGGKLSGEARRQSIRFGVERPVRLLTLARPFAIGPLTLSAFDARISDYGTVSGVADADIDPTEIVVTATGRQKTVPEFGLTLGRDVMRGCSSIEFDKARQQIVLTCS